MEKTMVKRLIGTILEGQGKYAGKAYFFRGDQYVRYDWAKDRVEAGYPLALAAWHLPADFVTGIDAALNGQGKYAGKAYFFKGNQYVRYDWASDRAEVGYPAALAAWNLPAYFAFGINAALNGQGKYAGKAYFFKGNQYVRYDWATDRAEAGYPAALAAWNLPAAFASGIDAAVNGQGKYAGKAYFFKGDQYVRYDWATDKVDAGYPLAITSWPGVAELLDVGIAKNQAIAWSFSTLSQLESYFSAAKLGVQDRLPNRVLMETALNTHFHVSPAQLTTYVPTISQNYQKVLAVLNNSATPWRYRSQAEAVTDRGVDNSGIAYPAYTFFNNSINFTTSFLKFGPLCQAAMVLHEPVHYVDAQADVNHDFYEHSSQYSTISADLAVHNPSSYVCFVQHLFYGRDERFGAGRASE
jgi:Hemopexin